MDITAELIPIESLNKILLDENERIMFENFELNRNHFSFKHSYDDYISELDSYVASLIREEITPKSEQLIMSYVENILSKNINTNKFYGSMLLSQYLYNQKNNSNYELFPSLKIIVNKFQNDFDNMKLYYLKELEKSDLKIDYFMVNIISNMVNLYGNVNFLLTLFFKGNKELKLHLINCYGVYFSVENLSYEQLLTLKPFFDDLLYSNVNQMHLSSISLSDSDNEKLNLLNEYIKSSDETIIKFLTKINAKNNFYIQELIGCIKDVNKLKFSNFVSGSCLSRLRLYELNIIFRECRKETILSILNDFSDLEVVDGYSQDLYLSLLLNLEDKEEKEKYILSNIKNKKRFNNRTIFNLLLSMKHKDALALLNHQSFIERFNCFEIAFLLKILQTSGRYIIKFLNKHYNESFGFFENVWLKYLQGLQRELVERKSINYINSLYYAWQIGSFSLLNYIDIMDIMKSLFSNENLDKKIDISTLESILYYFFNLNVNHETSVSIQSPMSFIHNTTYGNFSFTNNRICINEIQLKSTPRDNLDIIASFFHEKSHYQQYKKMKNADPDFKLIQITKEFGMYKSLVYGNKEAIISDNYCKLGIECDANLRGILENISFLDFVNKNLADSLYSSQKKIFKTFLNNRKQLERVDYSNNIVYDTDYMFDLNVPKTKIQELIKDYPVLSYEYHENGEKKSVIEFMFSLRENIEHLAKLKNADLQVEDKSYFVKKVRVYRELLKKRQTFLTYNGEIISNKQEKFNDWVTLIDCIGYNLEINLQIVDYLMASVMNFLEVANSSDLLEAKDLFIVLCQKLSKVTNVELSNKDAQVLFLESLKTYRQVLIYLIESPDDLMNNKRDM